MQAEEIELKFSVTSIPVFERKLAELGFQLDTPRTLELNTLYDTPDRTLRARGELLRLRQYGFHFVATHKRHPEKELPASLYKVRIETETEVNDGAALATIFSHLGFTPAFRYEKYRTEYSHPAQTGAHLVLDETPIGIYAELEGPPAWIDRTLAALEVDHSQCMRESYGRLFLDWKQRTGSKAENLTFDEVASAWMVAS